MINMKIVRDRPVSAAVALVVLVMTVLFGSGWFATWLSGLSGFTVVPAAVGVPAALPGLRLWPLGATTWIFTIVDSIAAVVLVVTATAWVHGTVRRHRDAGTVRLLVSGWIAMVGALAAANLCRVVAASFAQDASPGAYAGYLLTGALLAVAWGLATGWLPGIAAALAARYFTRHVDPDGPLADIVDG